MMALLVKLLGFLILCCLVVSSANGGNAEPQCGVEASPNPLHHNPWAVLLEFYNRGLLAEFRCGGTLIDSRHVVTAAHCVTRLKHHLLKIRLGDYDLSKETDCVDGVCADPFVTRVVSDVFIHPGYDLREHDIAILKFDEPVAYTDFIRPACLPTGSADPNLVFNAAGWGESVDTGRYSDVKKSVTLSTFPHDCRHVYRHDAIPRLSICAGGEKGVDTCRGDSGGPLTAKRRHIELFGVIASGSSSCGREGAPGIYTSVREHLSWIHKVLGTT